MNAVAYATIHHEGGGKPDDDFGFLHKDYSIGIGVTRYELRRPPWESFITTNQGVRSLQCCFSGDMRFYELTDARLDLLQQAVGEARTRGWVTTDPLIRPHGLQNVPVGFVAGNGLSECPGTRVLDRWADVVRAVRGEWRRPEPALTPGAPEDEGFDMDKTTFKLYVAEVMLELLDNDAYEAKVRQLVRAGIAEAFTDPADTPAARRVQGRIRDLVAEALGK